MQVGVRRLVVFRDVRLHDPVWRELAWSATKTGDAFDARERTVQSGAAFHRGTSKDGHDLGQCLGVVVRVEEGEAAREEAEENDAG